MALVLIGVAGWLIAAVAAGLFVVSLGRAAAIADRDELERVESASARFEDRREGSADRRAAMRPWGSESPGRRREDQVRRELVEARRELRNAEERLAAAESRSASGAA